MFLSQLPLVERTYIHALTIVDFREETLNFPEIRQVLVLQNWDASLPVMTQGLKVIHVY